MTDGVLQEMADVHRDTIPLLVRMPNGESRQIDVPLNGTVDDVRDRVVADLAMSPDVRLSFGNTDLRSGQSLVDTTIIPAYQHAGSLLQLIGTGGLDADKKAQALDSACAVVESISNGKTDMEALCAAAAMPPDLNFAAFPNPPASPRTARVAAEVAAAGAEEDDQQTPKYIGSSEFRMFDSLLARSRDDAPAAAPASNHADADGLATPSRLARSLSKRLPSLFPSVTVGAAAPEGSQPNGHQLQPTPYTSSQPPTMPQPGLLRRQSSLIIQPSISSIREARRRARTRMATLPKRDGASVDDDKPDGIGGSTVDLPPTRDVEKSVMAAAASGSSCNNSFAVMANSGKSTWLEDVIKTWEVGTVRDSGILETAEGGKELNNYLEGLEAEAQREVDMEAEKRASLLKDEGGPGGSGDEEEEYDGEDEDEDVDGAQGEAVSSADRNSSSRDSGVREIRESMSTIAVTGNQQPPRIPADSSNAAYTAAAAIAAASLAVARPPSSRPPAMPSSRPTPYSFASSASSGAPSQNTNTTENSSPQPGHTRGRMATKIAPAPDVPSTMPGGGGGGGVLPNPMFPPGMAMPPGWVHNTQLPGPKRRGRKRKNPELTEEERALVRKEQNRESAKLSRVRRKVIAAEYEGRLTSLIDENSDLRRQVDGLNNRLICLQSLLTVSVRQDSVRQMPAASLPPGTNGMK